MKSEPESSSTHTITINGQQYQIVSPAAEALQALTASGAGMAAASSRSHSSGNLHYPTTSNRGNSRVVSVSGSESETGLMDMVSRSTEESARKRNPVAEKSRSRPGMSHKEEGVHQVPGEPSRGAGESEQGTDRRAENIERTIHWAKNVD